MLDKCLAGIKKDTKVLDAYAAINWQTIEDVIDSMEENGCYVVIADKALTIMSLGNKIDNVLDLIEVTK